MFLSSHKVRIMIPSYRNVINQDAGKNYTVYCVEIIHNGKITTVEKRYSEFYELYRKLQKIIDAKISFPPKRVFKDDKLLENRRRLLEFYLQAVLHEVKDDIPERLMDFLEINNVEEAPYSYDESYDDVDGDEDSYTQVGNYPQTHQSVICFKKDIYLHITAQERHEERYLPSIVMKGCLEGVCET